MQYNIKYVRKNIIFFIPFMKNCILHKIFKGPLTTFYESNADWKGMPFVA